MNVNLTFLNKEQEQFFWHLERNGMFDGGFGNGKTYSACERAFVHLATFPNYGFVFAREKYKILKRTTMKTFFKICPDKFIHIHNNQDGYTILKNGSFIYWIHLQDFDESDIRGLEFNSACIDQAEEIQEGIYLVFDGRVGRWDKAIVPDWLLAQRINQAQMEDYLKIQRERPELAHDFLVKNSEWPKTKHGRFRVPNYMDILANCPDDDEFHWSFRRYNPQSLEKQPDHFYIHRETDQSMYDEKTYQQMLLRDPEWVDKYVKGIIGKSKAAIHSVDKISVINPDDTDLFPSEEDFEEFLYTLLTRSALYRTLDHGDTGVTCCTWGAAFNNIHVIYREYYTSYTLISAHRINIDDLSKQTFKTRNDEVLEEDYVGSYADPQIFKKAIQKVDGLNAGFTHIADEYMDEEYTDSPPIYWLPGDNNEFATRNRINEFLIPSPRYLHPVTKQGPAPGLFFIQKGKRYPFGCDKIIIQTKSQRRLLLGTDNGRKIYSDERDKTITDHAYDTLRYYIAIHSVGVSAPKRKVKRNTFAYYNELLKKRSGFRSASEGYDRRANYRGYYK